MAILRAGYAALALQLQEAADSGDSLSAGDIQNRLRDAISDAFRGTGTWGYYIDHFGDAESGDVIFSCNGDTKRAPYEISGTEGAAKCVIDTEHAEDVVPRTVYEVEADEDDHYAAMESAAKRDNIYTALPAYERFVPKKERDAAGASSFAGKNKSFPILKAADVSAAAHALGRAGSDNYDAGTIKKNIVRIAKEKGFDGELPKAWREKSAKESAGESASGKLKPQSPAAIRLQESCAFPSDLVSLREALKGGSKTIKLISPGKGSSAWYTPEALKLAASENIFRAGTPMRIDHPTESQKAERPEGSVKDWGAVLESGAKWLDAGAEGPGLYGTIKPFSDHAQTIEEKGPYAGVSIDAWGEPLKENGRVVMRDGVPVLAKFTSADGVDMVTRAGAGGLFLQEAARAAIPTQEASMDANELKLLRESLAANEQRTVVLLEKELRREAIAEGAKLLQEVSLPASAKEYVIETVLRGELPKKDGALDMAKFSESVNAEAKRFGSAIGQGARVTGMGTAATQPTPEDQKRVTEAAQLTEAQNVDTFSSIFGSSEEGKKMAIHAVKGRAA